MNLADALRALPLAAPERSAWPQLAAQLNRQTGDGRRETGTAERFRRFVVPAALAAALALVFVATHKPRENVSTQSTATTATVAPASASSPTNSAQETKVHNATNATDPARLAALQQRSQELEGWLRETGGTAAPLQGQDLAAATEIENLIGLVDVELATPREAQDATLWHRRVDLLEDLSALRYSNYQLAAGGRVIAASMTN
jgi:hypothetical protein